MQGFNHRQQEPLASFMHLGKSMDDINIQYKLLFATMQKDYSKGDIKPVVIIDQKPCERLASTQLPSPSSPAAHGRLQVRWFNRTRFRVK